MKRVYATKTHGSGWLGPSPMNRLARSLFVVLLLGAPAVARAEEPTEMSEARKQFQAGVNLLDDPDGAKYEEAYHAFKKAYELSRSPKVLGNIGFCALHLERDGEAIDAYSGYLREAPDVDERERAQIQRDLATMTSTVAKLRVHVKRRNGSALVLVDTRLLTRGTPIENSYPVAGSEIAIRVRPGRHALKLKDAEGESVAFETNIEPGSEKVHELVFPPPKAENNLRVMPRESPSMAGPIVLGVTGLLAVGGGVTMGLLARSKTAEIGRSCPGDTCPATYDLDGARTRAKTYGTMADVGFVAGGTLIAGAALWYLLLPSSRADRRGQHQPNATAMCTHQGCGVQLQGGF